MSNFLFVVAVLAFLFLIAMAIRGKNKRKAKKSPTYKVPLTAREQAMYRQLISVLPDFVVLAQVSHSAFLRAPDIAVFRTFSQKVADYVVCDHAFQVLAVIELDDASHRYKQEQDAQRDAVLASAGIRVIRYANIPDASKLQSDFRAERLKVLKRINR